MQLRSVSNAIGLRALVRAMAPVLLLSATTALADERVFNKTLAVTPGGTLSVDSDTGSVTVRGTDAKEVAVHATIRGSRRHVEKFSIDAKGTDTGVEIRGKRDPSSWLSLSWLFEGGLEVNYTIAVPRDYHVRVHTSGGDLELTNINGRSVARTSGGDVRLNSLNGDAEIRTSGGNIRTLHFIGNARFSTSGGNIVVDESRGELRATTSGGDIRMQAVDSKLAAHTSGGDVDVALAGGYRGAELRTSGGDITVRLPREIKASVDARTSGGDVECDLPVTVAGNHKDSALLGDINGGGQPLFARTSGGDIRIRAAE
jgi:DUF4097 and DUF4098 domain-containing protein YvlB